MDKFTQFVSAYWPVFMVLVGWPVITGLLNWYLWWDTPANWDAFQAAHPRLAFLVRLNRAWGPHLRKVVTAWRDYAAAKSGGPPTPPPPPAVAASPAA